MDPVVMIIFIVGFALVIYFVFPSRADKAKRKLGKTQETQLDLVKDGETVKVTGKITMVGKTLISPLAKRTCVYWHVLVWDMAQRTDYVVIDQEGKGDVVLEKNGLYIIVDTAIVNSHLIKDKKYYTGIFDKPNEALNFFLKKQGLAPTNILGLNHNFKYEEGVLEQGELVAVMGVAKWVKREETKLNLPQTKILKISAVDKEDPVAISDDPFTM